MERDASLSTGRCACQHASIASLRSVANTYVLHSYQYVAAVAYTIVDRRVASVVYRTEPSQKKNKKHWDWDSAYHRQGSYQCRDTAPEPDRHQKLTICSLAQPSLKISCKSVRKFLRKVDNRQQTDKQTNNDENITSLAEVITKKN